MAELEFTYTNQSIQGQAEKILDLQREILLQNDKIASGRLIESLEYKLVKDEAGKVAVLFYAEDYADFVNDGRKPNPRNDKKGIPPLKPITDWIQEKRIKPKSNQTIKQLSFAIAMGIRNNGFRPVPFIEQSFQLAEQLFNGDDIVEALAKDVDINLQKTANEIF